MKLLTDTWPFLWFRSRDRLNLDHWSNGLKMHNSSRKWNTQKLLNQI